MEKIIEATDAPRTLASLEADLKHLGVKQGDILLVHTSMKAIGFVSGGAQAVIEALCKAVGEEGTIVMPAQSGDWTDPAEWEAPAVPEAWHEEIRQSMPAYHPAKTPTRGIGTVPELFRTFPGVIRSNHPAVSFAAGGKDAKSLMADHSLAYGLGESSPLRKLEDAEAKVLMLGADYDATTCFHLAEYRQPELPVIEKGAPILNEQGERVWTKYEEIKTQEDRFLLCGKAMEHLIKVQSGKIGSAESRLFSLPEAVEFAADWLNT